MDPIDVPLLPLNTRFNQASLSDLTNSLNQSFFKPPFSYSFITETRVTLSVPFHKNLNNN